MRLTEYVAHPGLLAGKFRWQMMYAGKRRDVTVDTWNGRLTFDSRDKLIGKYLYVQRAYERRYIERALAVLERDGWITRGGTLLDVGANIGMICIALLRHGWCARAIAFEPAPSNLRLLEHNVAQNGLADRIVRQPIALSSGDGEMELELSDYNSGDNRLRAPNGAAAGVWHEDRRATVRVPVRRLDDVLAEHPADASDVRLIWLDIQGHEGQFFEGARDTIGRGIPVVSEFWPYGILRSGMTRTAYLRTVCDLFTHVYVLAGERIDRTPVASIDALFDACAAPKAMREVVFVRERRS
jgi:FkbM family methyltransferase